MLNLLRLLVLLGGLGGSTILHAQTPPAELRVLAAGSLRAALTDIATAFESDHPGIKVRLTFGASGLLKDRIATGEPADVFASANMEHPEALAAAGRATAVQRFARNEMCLLARPGVDLKPETVVPQMLDPAWKLGTSTPKSDPAGDYAWQVFDRIEQNGRPGAARALAAKALQLTGGPQSPPAPLDRSVYGVLVSQGAADLFLIYCTNALVAAREQPGLQVVHLPDQINVSASYGITVLNGAPPAAQRFVDFVLSPGGQAVLARQGFAPR
jgi:ABC-type molybdate transport system substrate-binding protein